MVAKQRLQRLRTLLFLTMLGFSGQVMGEGLQAINLLPPNTGRSRAESQLFKQLDMPVVLLEPDLAIVDAIRGAYPNPEREACMARSTLLMEEITQKAWITAPDSAGDLFSALLEQAEKQILFLELESALHTLEKAHNALPCAGTILAREKVRSLYLLEAVAHVYLEDDAHAGSFGRVVAIDPEFQLGPDFSREAHQALETARKALQSRPARPVSFTTLEGAFYLDGTSLGTQQTIQPGNHILQLKSVTGNIRSKIIEVADIGHGEMSLRLDPLKEFGLPSSREVLQTLADALHQKRLNEYQIDGMDRYIASRSLTELIFAVAPRGEAMIRVYHAGGGIIDTVGVPVDAPAGGPPSTVRNAVDISDEASPSGRNRYRFHVSTNGVARFVTVKEPEVIIGDPSMGFNVHLRILLEALTVGLYAEWSNTPFRSSKWQQCGTLTGDTPTPDQIECAVLTADSETSSSPLSSISSLGLGAGYPVRAGHRVLMLPELYLQYARFDDLVAPLEAHGTGYNAFMLIHAKLYGPSARFRLSYLVIQRPSAALDLGLDLSFGAVLGWVEEETLAAFPLEVRAGIGLLF